MKLGNFMVGTIRTVASLIYCLIKIYHVVSVEEMKELKNLELTIAS